MLNGNDEREMFCFGKKYFRLCHGSIFLMSGLVNNSVDRILSQLDMHVAYRDSTAGVHKSHESIKYSHNCQSNFAPTRSIMF